MVYLERAHRLRTNDHETLVELGALYINREFYRRGLTILLSAKDLTPSNRQNRVRLLSLVLRASRASSESPNVDWAADELLVYEPDRREALEHVAMKAIHEEQWSEAQDIILELLGHHQDAMSAEGRSNWLYLLGPSYDTAETTMALRSFLKTL